MMIFKKNNGNSVILDVRHPNKSDCDGIIDCFYDVFEGSYLNPNVFKKGYFYKRTQTEDFTIIVAVDSTGRIISTCSIYFNPMFPGGCEFGLYATRNEYRGYGIGSYLVEMLYKQVLEHGCEIMYAHMATHMNVSQHQFETRGFMPSGFWFLEYDHNRQAVNFNNATCKLTSLTYVKYCNKKDCGDIYVNAKLREVTEYVYKYLGVSFKILTEDSVTEEKSQMIVKYNQYHHTLYITVDKCGQDFIIIMKDLHNQYPDTPMQTVILLLNISSPYSCRGYEQLKNLGYVFSGFAPMTKESEYMIMSYKGVENLKFDEIKTTVIGKKLMDKVTFFQKIEEIS